MRAAGHELADLLDVADVRKTPAHFAVGHDIEQVKSRRRRDVAGLEDAANRRLPAFAVGAHRLLFLRGQPTLGITWSETPVPHRRVIPRGLVHAREQLRREFWPRRARSHDLFAADEFARFLEDHPRA